MKSNTAEAITLTEMLPDTRRVPKFVIPEEAKRDLGRIDELLSLPYVPAPSSSRRIPTPPIPLAAVPSNQSARPPRPALPITVRSEEVRRREAVIAVTVIWALTFLALGVLLFLMALPR